jgi:predicted nucleic acid-binding Zn ribbon protein
VTSAGEDFSPAARLEALERDNRRLQRFGMLLIVGMAVLLALGVVLVYTSRSVAPEVSARSFVLRDADGTVRGVWGVAQEDSSLRFVLQDPAGRPRIRMSLLGDGSAGISLIDSAGQRRAVFALEASEGGSVVLADNTGRTRTVLGVSPDGAATVVFADRNGATRAGLGVDNRGLGTFTLDDAARRAPIVQEDTAPADTALARPVPKRR